MAPYLCLSLFFQNSAVHKYCFLRLDCPVSPLKGKSSNCVYSDVKLQISTNLAHFVHLLNRAHSQQIQVKVEIHFSWRCDMFWCFIACCTKDE